MKKSVAFRLAQDSVLSDNSLRSHEKVAILRILFAQEDFEKFCEDNKKEEGEEG